MSYPYGIGMSYLFLEGEIMIEQTFTGNILAAITTEAEGITDYNSIRFWVKGEEVQAEDVQMVVYQDKTELDVIQKQVEKLGLRFAPNLKKKDEFLEYLSDDLNGDDLSSDAFFSFMDDVSEWNTCSCCGLIVNSVELVWNNEEQTDAIRVLLEKKSFEAVCNDCLDNLRNTQEVTSSYKTLIKSAFDTQVNIDVDGKLSSSEYIDKAVESYIRDYGSTNKEEARLYITTIVAKIEESNICNISLPDCEICDSCQKVLLPDDEAYSKHDGEALCSECSHHCEGCDKNYTSDEMVLNEDVNSCKGCLSKVELIIVNGYWKDSNKKFCVNAAIEETIYTEADDEIFYYFDSKESVIGDHGDFVIVSFGLPNDNETNEEIMERLQNKKIALDSKEYFIRDIESNIDFGSDMIDIPFGSNQIALILDNKTVEFNSHNEERMIFKDIEDFASYYYEDDIEVEFEYQIPLGTREDDKDVFRLEEFKNYKQSQEDDCDEIWSEKVKTYLNLKSLVKFPTKKIEINLADDAIYSEIWKQIKEDVKFEDFSSIFELLSSVPKEDCLAYLSEEVSNGLATKIN